MMLDMRETTQAKSDQLNAIDLIGGPITIKVTEVKQVAGDQPIHVHYENENGRPWKPCKNMRRVMVKVWGYDADAYSGKTMVLFNDPSVKWGGKEQGGIRISHMSDMKSDKMRIPLPETRGKIVNWLVKAFQTIAKNKLAADDLEGWRKDIESAKTMATLQDVGKRIKAGNYDDAGSSAIRSFYVAAQERIRADVNPEPVDPKNEDFPPEVSKSSEVDDIPGM